MLRHLRQTILAASLALGFVGAGLPSTAFAQPAVDRLAHALVVTDTRIEAAAAQVRAAPNPEAELALERARSLQAQARDVAARGGPPRRAGNLTLLARAQAEHAIAVLRGLPDVDRVAGQLERTHAMLENVRARVGDCGDDSVRDLLREADDIQHRAESAAAEGRPLSALQLTFAARERGQDAMHRCRIADDLPGRAGHALQTTDTLIARARSSYRPSASPRDMLERADALQSQARDAYHAGRFPLALRLTGDAGALARRAARLSEVH